MVTDFSGQLASIPFRQLCLQVAGSSVLLVQEA